LTTVEFLRRLLLLCRNWLATLLKLDPADREVAASIPIELQNHDVVARLLYTKNHFSSQKSRPKPAAFDPWPYNELSTVHVTGLADVAVWEVAVNTLTDQSGRSRIYARADVPVNELTKLKLRAVRDDDPFTRHTLVLGWPNVDDANQRKEQWKEICLALSQSPQVALVIPPAPIVRLMQ
jgi:hypothetical protein